MIASLIYNLSIRLYGAGISIASLFTLKARQFLRGRRNWQQRLADSLPGDAPLIWFHAASLGEFEQGRPLIESIRTSHPQYKILLSFFSPSGYEIRKNYAGADYICYLPLDTAANARRFIETARPSMVFFIKYEFWFNYLRQIRQHNIPLYYVSAIFRSNQHFFQPWGGWFRKQLQNVNWFFVQNKNSLKLLSSLGLQNASVCGDTRFDRVWSVAQERKAFPQVAAFAEGQRVLLAGSTWPADEELLLAVLRHHPKEFRCIIAPHEIDSQRIDDFIRKAPVKCIRYSRLSDEETISADVLIIDNIGILLHLYQYAHAAYIGGGFGKNIHNILEAATFGKPVVFGPNYRKFQEAHELLALRGAFCVHRIEEAEEILLRLFRDDAFHKAASQVCSAYVQQNLGGTKHILHHVFHDQKPTL